MSYDVLYKVVITRAAYVFAPLRDVSTLEGCWIATAYTISETRTCSFLNEVENILVVAVNTGNAKDQAA